MRRPLLALLLAAACSPAGPPPAAIPPLTTATVAVPPPGEPPPPAPIASATAPAEPPPPPQPPPPDPCVGAAFDLDALPDCSTHRRGEPPSQTAGLAVALVPDAPRVRSGETLGATVVFTNKGSAPLPLDVKGGCTSYELGVYDARGARRDYVLGDCGTGGGCGGSVLRLVVAPGGTLVKHLHVAARVIQRSSKTRCEDFDAGGLPPGKYTLRATSYLGSWLDEPEGGGHVKKTVTAPIEVTR